jgi:hypothetical protein
MVAAVAFVPSPPLLLAALGGGPEFLRAACTQAISALDGLDVVVLGAAPSDGWVSGTIDATPWGAPGVAAPAALPLALAVGSTLLGERHHTRYGVAAGGLPELGDVGLLVVGDGSARRTEKAPGHLDERAASFDGRVAAALAAGSPALLGALDASLAGALLVGGMPVWQAVSQLSGSWQGVLHLADAPYGVGYFAASWTPLRP